MVARNIPQYFVDWIGQLNREEQYELAYSWLCDFQRSYTYLSNRKLAALTPAERAEYTAKTDAFEAKLKADWKALDNEFADLLEE